MQTVSGKTYYFKANGRGAKSAFEIIGGKKYYFNDQSMAVMDGWFRVGNDYYYAKGGVVQTNTVVEGYKVDANGKSATKALVVQLVSQYTKPTMSNQQKIDALYDWLYNNDMTYIRTYEHVYATWVWQDSWVDDMGKSLYDNWGGNCYRYASLLGMMIHEATGLQVKVCRGYYVKPSSPHGWIVVYQDNDWYVYDVELDKFNWAEHTCRKLKYDDTARSKWYFQEGEIKLY